eukprot:3208164-Amphidinium_carterae.1
MMTTSDIDRHLPLLELCCRPAHALMRMDSSHCRCVDGARNVAVWGVLLLVASFGGSSPVLTPNTSTGKCQR